jgi:hypothetical protein
MAKASKGDNRPCAPIKTSSQNEAANDAIKSEPVKVGLGKKGK